MRRSLGCVFCSLSTAAQLSERERARKGTLQTRDPQRMAGEELPDRETHRADGSGTMNRSMQKFLKKYLTNKGLFIIIN
mgnify:CR=1 FL=1